MQPVATTTVTAAASIDKNLFVGFTGALCASGAKAMGVSQTLTDPGDALPVTYLGIMPVVAGAAVAAGVQVQSDASGRAITLAAGASNGYALDAASAAGDLIRVLIKI